MDENPGKFITGEMGVQIAYCKKRLIGGGCCTAKCRDGDSRDLWLFIEGKTGKSDTVEIHLS